MIQPTTNGPKYETGIWYNQNKPSSFPLPHQFHIFFHNFLFSDVTIDRQNRSFLGIERWFFPFFEHDTPLFLLLKIRYQGQYTPKNSVKIIIIKICSQKRQRGGTQSFKATVSASVHSAISIRGVKDVYWTALVIISQQVTNIIYGTKCPIKLVKKERHIRSSLSLFLSLREFF